MTAPAGRVVTRRTLRLEGGTVGYRTGGRGPVTVVVGSIARSGASVLPLLERLAVTGTAVAVDPPGYGLSDRRPGDTSIEVRAGRLDRALDALGVRRATLLGRHSGGLVALHLAWTAPGRYPAVILDDPPLLPEPERHRWAAHYAPEIPVALDGSHIARHWMLRRLELLHRPWFDAPDGVTLAPDLTTPDALTGQMHSAVLDRLAAGDDWADPYQAMFAYDPVPALAEATVPIHVLAEGPVTDGPTVSVVDAPAGANRDEVLVELAGRLAGHAAPLDAPSPPDEAPPGRTVDLATTPWGQIAVRRLAPPAPTGRRPLVMLHASPLSGVSLIDLAGRFGATRPVMVLDTLGSGDSDPLDPAAEPELRNPRIGDYAAAAGAALDDLGVPAVDLYGTHTGAVIGLELAIARPELVHRLVLNGVPLFDPATVDGTLADYFIDMEPRWDGAHLTAAWSFTVEVMLWYPWHVRNGEHRRCRPNLGPGFLHERFVQLVKGGPRYSAAQRAALVHPTRRRLGQVRVPTLVCSAPGDPLAPVADDVARLAGGADRLSLVGPDRDAADITAWLDAGPTREGNPP